MAVSAAVTICTLIVTAKLNDINPIPPVNEPLPARIRRLRSSDEWLVSDALQPVVDDAVYG